jgi:putative membrane protein
MAYDDLKGLVGYLDTFARTAHEAEGFQLSKKTPWKAAGEYLGVSFAESNPRKVIKRAKKPLGNLPLEIITYLAAYTDSLINNDLMPIPAHQSDVSKYMIALDPAIFSTHVDHGLTNLSL